MALIDGDDFVLGDLLSYQQANRLKDHWRQSDPVTNVTNAQPGMIESDADDDKLYHVIGSSGGHDEILQAAGSSDTTPQFDNLILDLESGALSDPPAAAEIDAIFGAAADVGSGFIGFAQDGTSPLRTYLFFSDGTDWFHMELTVAL